MVDLETARFLVQNMKEMEIELRAQSIALHAVATGIARVDELEQALNLSRQSTGMLDHVQTKYRRLEKLVLAEGTSSTESEALFVWKGSSLLKH